MLPGTDAETNYCLQQLISAGNTAVLWGGLSYKKLVYKHQRQSRCQVFRRRPGNGICGKVHNHTAPAPTILLHPLMPRTCRS